MKIKSTSALLLTVAALYAPASLDAQQKYRTSVTGRGPTTIAAYNAAVRQVPPGFTVVHSNEVKQGGQVVITLVIERNN